MNFSDTIETTVFVCMAVAGIVWLLTLANDHA